MDDSLATNFRPQVALTIARLGYLNSVIYPHIPINYKSCSFFFRYVHIHFYLTVCVSIFLRQATMPQCSQNQDSMVLHNSHINHQHDYLVTSGVPQYPTSTLNSMNSSTTSTNTHPLRNITDDHEMPDYENSVHPQDLEGGSNPDPPPGELNRSTSMLSTSITNTRLKKKMNTDSIRVLKIGFVFSLFVAILISATLSKVSFFAIASKLYETVVNASNYTGTTRNDPTFQSVTFTQIVIVLMAPQLITSVRMFFAGIVGKSKKNYPWPSFKALCGVRTIAITLNAIFVADIILYMLHI